MRLRSGGENAPADDMQRNRTRNGDTGSISGTFSGLETSNTRSKLRLSPRSGATVTKHGTVSETDINRRTIADADRCESDANCAHKLVPNATMKAAEINSNNMGDVAQNHTTSTANSSSIPGRGRATEELLPHNVFVVWFLKVFMFLLVLFFFIIPAFIKIYPAIVVDVAFLNHVRWPPFINLNQPSDFGLNYTRTFKLDTTDGVTVGAWQVVPEMVALRHVGTNAELSVEQYRSLLQSGEPVILYLHGNAGTRGGWHRVQLYKVLARAGYHVVTFDYRGYGDSTGFPSEDGLVSDSVTVFKWLKRQTGNVPVYIWGHSLGSAVATRTASRLCAEGADFNGLILESPFNNFIEAASNHPFSLPFRVMPWFTWVFIEAIKLNGIRFASDEHIQGVTVPIMILHATDDTIVPYPLGRKLYEVALRRPSGASQVEFVTFDGEHGYGHKHIHKSPQLVNFVRKFISDHSLNK